MTQQLQPQEQIQAYAVEALWLQTVIITLAIVGGVMSVLPKILKPAEEKK